jgi:hypothetical protein
VRAAWLAESRVPLYGRVADALLAAPYLVVAEMPEARDLKICYSE